MRELDKLPRSFGPADAAVRLSAEWPSPSVPVPDLDDLPEIVERIGVDLHPLPAAGFEDRLWLRALVWPEHRDRLEQLDAILDAVAEDLPTILDGDAIELLPRLGSELPAGVPIVAFHAMVRCHAPSSSVEAFDAAIARLGVGRRLLHVSL
jgi:hypothetical protein